MEMIGRPSGSGFGMENLQSCSTTTGSGASRSIFSTAFTLDCTSLARLADALNFVMNSIYKNDEKVARTKFKTLTSLSSSPCGLACPCTPGTRASDS